MSKLSEQLIQIQRKNYRKNMKLIQETLGHNPAVDNYQKEYSRHLKNYQEVSTKADLIRDVLASDVVYHGDYHTLKQSQRSVLRLLREVQGKREMILCLEMFHADDQHLVDSFMSGELSENSFLRKIEYAKKWPFNWSHFSPIISFCRENKIPVFGINLKGGEGGNGLRHRDNFAARIIARAIIRYVGKLVYVLDGDYHISPNHLPHKVERLLKLLDLSVKSLIIYQNAVNLYWRLCREGREESNVLKINEGSYCVMNTMPANKIQSYLNWLEYSEDAYYPVHQDWEDETVSQGLTVPEMVNTIASLLNLVLPANVLEKLAIYYSNNLHFMDLIDSILELKGESRIIKQKIKREEGFLLEYKRSGEDTYLIYLANSNINMAAEEAGHFVNVVLRGPLKARLKPFDRFYRDVITECLGFFCSKLINEKRRSQSVNSLRRLLGQAKQGRQALDAETLQVARYILQHFYLQRKTDTPSEFIKKFYPLYKSRSSLSRVFSTQLGYMLGNRLFYAVKKGKFPLEKVREYFQEPFEEAGKAFGCYLELRRRVRKLKP
jgi:hypothetical protein